MNPKKQKKAHKSPKVPIPIKIKKEDDGVLRPMSHYLDDRVELVKQVFSALKPKTIKNLAPDFLKKSELEEIEELCLNELLGISTKRLKSIIEGTKCPSDTDSSSDSDVDHVEDHISLEEISSDSDNPPSANKAKTNTKRKDATKPKPEKGKEMSVLELLELQARARAIRSQLALEPITKIEVDSDDSTDGKKEEPLVVSSQQSQQSHASNGTASTSGGTQKSSKRIKLKRNFGKHLEEAERVEPETIKRERSSSPDVITIIPSPEMLFISDSDSGGEEKEEENNVGKDDPVVAVDPVVVVDPVVEEEKEKAVEVETAEKTVEEPAVEPEEGEISDSDDKVKETLKESEVADVDNDDVISLEGGDLVDEMRGHLEAPVKKEQEPPGDSDIEEVCDPANDVITLDDSSGDERLKEDGKSSWSSRWLNSSKVSKVLATSRLGNRVREKIKKSKEKEKEKERERERERERTNSENAASKKAEDSPLSKYEDGSLEQYKELINMKKH